MKNLKTRDSNMELLRIIAITFIVLYHLTAFFANAWGEENRLMYSLNLMLHTGVILFVLISGYYGIDPKSEDAAYLQGEIAKKLFPAVAIAVCPKCHEEK